MRWLAAPSLLLATASAPAPPPILALASDAEARWVAFELTPHNQIRFTLDLDGRPVTAILDTAVSSSAVSRGYAHRMRLALRDDGTATAIGGATGVQSAASGPITLGGLRRTGGRLAVVDLAAATGGDPAVEMLVGGDLTAGFALDIDYPARRFRLLQSGRLPFQGTSVPLAIGTDRSFYIAELRIGDRRVRPMVIDTGDGGAIAVSDQSWRTLAVPAPRMTSTMSYGLGGPVIADLTVLPAVSLGTLLARNVELTVERADGYSRGIGAAGRIGSGFLRRYHVLLDPAAGHMVLSPGPDADAPPLRSTSGLLVAAAEGALIVRHVMKGGPGDVAGWHDGDRICSVDGTRITAASGADWPIGAPGRTVTFGMCDGTARSLTLTSFY